MRSHQKIVQDFGASKLGRALVDAGVELRPSSPQRWADRNSIPSEYWAVIVTLGATTLEELATSAAESAVRIPDASQGAAA